MGLIKTAIMTGGGIYAVNKLAKANESRHNNSNYNPNRDQSYSPQPQSRSPPPSGYYHGPSTAPQTREVYAERESRGEGYWVPAPTNANDRAVYEREKWEREQAWMRHQEQEGYSSPPAYGQGQSQQQYVPQGQIQGNDQVYERRGQGNGSNTSLGGLAGMAMDFVDGQGQNGKKGEGLGKLFK
jgi:hypothetical protein